MSLQGGGQEEAADKDEQTEENKAETTDTIKPPGKGNILLSLLGLRLRLPMDRLSIGIVL